MPPESGPRTPPGQPDHRSTKGPVTRHVDRPHPPAQRPYSDHSQEQTTLTISNAASVCRLHYWPRPHCSLATLPRFALQLDAPVLVVFRKCSHSSSNQLSQVSSQANVSSVSCVQAVAVIRVASPPVVHLHESPQYHWRPALSPVSTKILRTHCVSAFE